MRSLRYLNTVLTLIAVLLTANLWVAWSVGPISVALPAHAAGIPDVGSQNQQIIDLLKSLNSKTEEQNRILTSGQVRVKVEAAPKDNG